MNELFVLAGIAVCHAICGKIAGKRYLRLFSRANFSELTVQKEKSLREGLRLALERTAPEFILLGERHDDSRQIDFIIASETMRLLAKNNIKQIFFELPSKHQMEIDRVAQGGKLQFELTMRSMFGTRERQVAVPFITQLIKNASDVGIRVIACDCSESFLTPIYQFNHKAMTTEARLIAGLGKRAADLAKKKIIFELSKKLADAWWSIGFKIITQHRICGDRKIVSFIKVHPREGSSLVYMGFGHVLNNSKLSLRNSLPHVVTMAFFSSRKGYDGIGAKLSTEAKVEELKRLNGKGVAFSPPNYVVCLDSGVVQKCNL